MRMHNPPHVGEILSGLYLEPMGLTITETAKAMKMTRTALSEIIHGKRSVSPKVAIKLAKAFGGSAQSWLNAQAKYDLWQTEQSYIADDVKTLYRASVAGENIC